MRSHNRHLRKRRRDVALLRECAGTEYSRNLATGILPVAKFRGNFAVSTRVLGNASLIFGDVQE
ncbi:hypothetical protein [Brunnivagina elsteri]|uniref:hypothetical protein n=1 Tax=Brunnivagina elsteri TaxID=1247191 RepID=UPI0011773C7A|nr:hypothetical protein [Calothrix elsteri]